MRIDDKVRPATAVGRLELLSPPPDGRRPSIRPNAIPPTVRLAAERVIAVRGQPAPLKALFERSMVPMVLVDGERRYLAANIPARLALRLSLGQLRRLRIDDLTPAQRLLALEIAWARLVESGRVAGLCEVASPDRDVLHVTYYALADALPDQHLIAFAPAEWHDDELAGHLLDPNSEMATLLTARELEVLQLAADGLTAPMIARDLVVSTATVRTHFQNIYEKLGVNHRAAAVAKAMRVGMIA